MVAQVLWQRWRPEKRGFTIIFWDNGILILIGFHWIFDLLGHMEYVEIHGIRGILCEIDGITLDLMGYPLEGEVTLLIYGQTQ